MSIHTKTSHLRGSTCADAVAPASILDRLPEMSEEAKDHVKGMLHYQGFKNWQYLQVVPPGSFLENLIELFRVETDIPLELPLAAALAQMSGFLNALGVSYEIGGVEHPAKLWSVVLAPSGSGKTFASDTVARWLSDASGDPVAPHIANASSAAQFVANIQATPRGLFLRDEFGQFLSQIQNLQHMEEVKDILLRAYSGGTIDRLTKGAQIVIKDHAITVLGITVAETFERQVGADSLVDGFAQRFNYVRAQPDPSRPLVDHLIYFKRLHEGANASRFQQMRQDWLKITARNDLLDATFTFEPDAIEHLENSFRALFLEGEIPASFFRRAMFSAFPYAVLFHIIEGRLGTVIDKKSISYAVRMVALHLDTARQMLSGYGLSELEQMIRKAEGVRDQLKAQGKKLEPRDLVSRIRSIKSAAQAKSVMELMKP